MALGWDDLFTIPAANHEYYGEAAETYQTSIPVSDTYHYTTFKVRANTSDSEKYYESPEMAGFSPDDTAHASPTTVNASLSYFEIT